LISWYTTEKNMYMGQKYTLKRNNSGMQNGQALIEMVNKPDFIANLYDSIRLVDPVQKEVRSYIKPDDSKIQSSSSSCYAVWGRNTVCENCISMRSFNQKRTTVKIEYGNDKIYIVTAVPSNDENSSPAIIELLKDITNDGIIDVEGLGPADLKKLVGRKNESIIRDAISRIYNEQYIFEQLPYELIKARKEGTNLALFLIRITNLETISDTYGSEKRDPVIKEIADAICQIPYKASDWTSRLHETDFVLVIHEMNENKANRICQRIRKKIGELKFSFLPEIIQVETAVGYHIATEKNITPDEILEKAGKMVSSNTIKNGPESSRTYHKFFDKYRLTQREREVAELLATGNSNNEIAEKTFVGLSTVKKHISAIFLKTGVKSRAELIARLAANS
jgi:two-component system, cell cycle response regulator